MSTESGIPDFRSARGLYNVDTGATDPPEVVLSHPYFVRHPDRFYDFYRTHLLFPDARPNPAHLALAALERAGKVSAVVTQNIDGLHQLAGSRTVFELHGSVLRNHCLGCGRTYPMAFILATTGVPRCEACGGIVRPDIVLYEESLDSEVISASLAAISHADTLIVGGTSLVVYPAAGLIRDFRGRHLVLINKSATGADRSAELVIREPIGEVLAPWVDAA